MFIAHFGGNGTKSVGRRKSSMKRKANIAGRVKGQQHPKGASNRSGGPSRYETIAFYGGWQAAVPKRNQRARGLVINKPGIVKQPSPAESLLSPQQLQELAAFLARR